MAWRITRRPRVRAAIRTATRRGLVPAPVWNRIPAAGEIEIELPGGGSFRYLAMPDDSVARQLLWRGLDTPEGATLTVLSRLARGADRVVDGGANVGLYSLAACASDPDCSVLAFEPLERNRRRLVEHLELNGFADRCEVRPEALSDRAGRGTLQIPEIERERQYPVGGSLDPFRRSATSFEVDLVRGDTLAGEADRIGLVKLDLEGAEAAALSGLKETIERDTPALIVERLPERSGEELEALVTRAGYRLFWIGPGGPREAASLAADPRRVYVNYLCLHRADSRLRLVSDRLP